MTTPQPPDLPQGCARCGSVALEPHCKSQNCPWLICGVLDCRAITGYACGAPRWMPSKMTPGASP